MFFWKGCGFAGYSNTLGERNEKLSETTQGGLSMLHPRSLTARPWKMVGLEDDPFLLGFGNFSEATLTFGRVSMV